MLSRGKEDVLVDYRIESYYTWQQRVDSEELVIERFVISIVYSHIIKYTEVFAFAVCTRGNEQTRGRV